MRVFNRYIACLNKNKLSVLQFLRAYPELFNPEVRVSVLESSPNLKFDFDTEWNRAKLTLAPLASVRLPLSVQNTLSAAHIFLVVNENLMEDIKSELLALHRTLTRDEENVLSDVRDNYFANLIADVVQTQHVEKKDHQYYLMKHLYELFQYLFHEVEVAENHRISDDKILELFDTNYQNWLEINKTNVDALLLSLKIVGTRYFIASVNSIIAQSPHIVSDLLATFSDHKTKRSHEKKICKTVITLLSAYQDYIDLDKQVQTCQTETKNRYSNQAVVMKELSSALVNRVAAKATLDTLIYKTDKHLYDKNSKKAASSANNHIGNPVDTFALFAKPENINQQREDDASKNNHQVSVTVNEKPPQPNIQWKMPKLPPVIQHVVAPVLPPPQSLVPPALPAAEPQAPIEPIYVTGTYEGDLELILEMSLQENQEKSPQAASSINKHGLFSADAQPSVPPVSDEEDDVLDNLCCTSSMELMEDPVRCKLDDDGRAYERKILLEYLIKFKQSPLGVPLDGRKPESVIGPLPQLKALVDAYRANRLLIKKR